MPNAVYRLPTLFALSLLLSFACYVQSSEAAEKKSNGPALTRSIYLPVEFKLCEHLHQAVLYESDQAVSYLPAKRIFQFTYYPHLERIEPTKTDVRVEGLRDDQEDFVGKLAVTPWGVFTANRKIELDLEEQLRRLRYKIDVRYETLTVKLRCSDTCSKEVVHTADAAENP